LGPLSGNPGATISPPATSGSVAPLVAPSPPPQAASSTVKLAHRAPRNLSCREVIISIGIPINKNVYEYSQFAFVPVGNKNISILQALAFSGMPF
jgi:hypothetical protein